MYKIFEIGNFEKDLRKLLNKKEYIEYERLKLKLKNGEITGKPINYNFFREKKIKNKRIYFLIYEEILIILFIDSSNKKYQQETINEIKRYLPKFKKYAYEIYFNSL